MSTPDQRVWVGPVLQPGVTTDAVIAALREQHAELEVVDRGGYLRVLAPGRCVLERAAVERLLGAPFTLPSDLERIMSSFKGKLRLTADEAAWELPAPRSS